MSSNAKAALSGKLATLAEDAGRIAQFRNLIYRRGEELTIAERCESDRHFNRRMRDALILFDRFLSLDLYQHADTLAPSASSLRMWLGTQLFARNF